MVDSGGRRRGNILLLRTANVNPDSVVTYTDGVLYSAIGMFILLYFAYATIGGASFVDASSNYGHPWWRWAVGPLVALAVISYDRAVVGRVSVSYDDLDSDDPAHLLKKRSYGVYVGRAVLAVLVAVIITEPLMLDRYRGEIDAYLSQVHNSEAAKSASAGPIKAYQDEKAALDGQDKTDDAAVDKLNEQAKAKRTEATQIYNDALKDSQGGGVTHKSGCPAGGYCDQLVQRSRRLQQEASDLDKQATDLRASQQGARDDRVRRRNDLDTLIQDAQQDNLTKIRANAGFGARTAAMWHLVVSDFAGVGIFYILTALLLIVLDCAAIGLKLLSWGNAYERKEAREARRYELEQLTLHRHDLKATRAAAEAYGEATTSIVAEGITAAADGNTLRSTVTEQASRQLRRNVRAAMNVPELPESNNRHRFRPFRRRRSAAQGDAVVWPADERRTGGGAAGRVAPEPFPEPPAPEADGNRRWTFD